MDRQPEQLAKVPRLVRGIFYSQNFIKIPLLPSKVDGWNMGPFPHYI